MRADMHFPGLLGDPAPLQATHAADRLGAGAEGNDEEDDGLRIGWPVAFLMNATAVILVALLVGKWLSCR